MELDVGGDHSIATGYECIHDFLDWMLEIYDIFSVSVMLVDDDVFSYRLKCCHIYQNVSQGCKSSSKPVS